MGVAKLVGGRTSVANVLRSTDSTFGHWVILAGDLGGWGNVGCGGGASQLEHGRSPLLTLLRHLLVLGRLGRDAAWKVDVGEDGIILRYGHVELLILSDLLGLVLALQVLLLGSFPVSLVDVGSLFWVFLDL